MSRGISEVVEGERTTPEVVLGLSNMLGQRVNGLAGMLPDKSVRSLVLPGGGGGGLGSGEGDGECRKRFFEELDRDGDGRVTLEDLEVAMRKRRLPRRRSQR
ncbi:hypothetical protein GUJ93_ZPchr0009g1384 [Zizania palustris]|uniref:EF-hand domain-containing protein n=1 Tax=Zizania palustris TaxID=103762 RepID=A0A8J5RSI3_ZIZPA|nr:hypothetical protein GUJ93_ZPchr0009g1384 [Zizania palustris]